MLYYVQPSFPKSFAIDFDKLAERICWACGVKDVEKLTEDVGWDYLDKENFCDYLEEEYPWFCIVDRKEQYELYDGIYNRFKNYFNKMSETINN